MLYNHVIVARFVSWLSVCADGAGKDKLTLYVKIQKSILSKFSKKSPRNQRK